MQHDAEKGAARKDVKISETFAGIQFAETTIISDRADGSGRHVCKTALGSLPKRQGTVKSSKK